MLPDLLAGDASVRIRRIILQVEKLSLRQEKGRIQRHPVELATASSCLRFALWLKRAPKAPCVDLAHSRCFLFRGPALLPSLTVQILDKVSFLGFHFNKGRSEVPSKAPSRANTVKIDT